MATFSMDLRRSILAVWQEQEYTQPELARLFGVSRSWLVKLLAKWRTTGSLAPRPHGGGREACLDPEDQDHLQRWLRRQPDLTLSELQERLERHTGTHASVPTLCRECQRLGLPRKKRRSTRRSGTGQTCVFSGKVGDATSGNWTPPTRLLSMKAGPRGP